MHITWYTCMEKIHEMKWFGEGRKIKKQYKQSCCIALFYWTGRRAWNMLCYEPMTSTVVRCSTFLTRRSNTFASNECFLYSAGAVTLAKCCAEVSIKSFCDLWPFHYDNFLHLTIQPTIQWTSSLAHVDPLQHSLLSNPPITRYAGIRFIYFDISLRTLTAN